MNHKQDNTLVESWYKRFNRQLLGFIGKSVKQEVDLQDMAQEIYLRMLRVKNPELIKSPKSYLYKVAIHVLDEWRNNNQNQNIHVDLNGSINSNESNKYQFKLNNISNQQLDLHEALESLPKIYSTTIIMKWHYGRTYKEIAKKLNISERQVKRYIIKGYTALRLKLAKDRGELK